MENRSFDHFLGWLPGADGKQAGLTYLDATGVRAPRPTSGARLPGLRATTTRTTPTTGARVEFERRRVRRLAARRRERRSTRSATTRRPTCLPRHGGAGVDGLRPLLRADPRPDLPQPLLPARRRRPTALANTPSDRSCPRSGTGLRPRACSAATTTATRLPRPLGSEYTPHQPHVSTGSSPTASAARCPTFSFVDPHYTSTTGRSGIGRRRPSARRHPRRRIFPRRRSTTP